MKQLNLSEWALNHRSLVAYLMIVAVAAGVLSYFRLGRNEDPSFIIKTMVVKAVWPGATTEETLNQITERLERTLEETPHLDFLRSFTTPGATTIFVNLKGSASAQQVADTWYHVRKSIADMRHALPSGVRGPFFNDEFGDTFGIIYGFTADGFTPRELRDHVEDVRSQLLSIPDVSKIEILGAQDEQIFIDFSMQELASLGIDRGALIAALQAQNIVRPAGVIQTGNDRVSMRVSGAFSSEQDISNVNFAIGGRMLRLSDIARIHRGYVDPPQPQFRVNGAPAIGLAIAMREGGDILGLGDNVTKEIEKTIANLPVGVEPVLVADQAVTVEHAISEFMGSLWQAVAIILAVSFISLGIRPGLVIALAIPLTLAIVFSLMEITGIDMQRISLGALIIALALLVDDAMTTTDATLSRLAQGDDIVDAATFGFRTYAVAMLAGTLVTIAGFVPVGFAASSAGEYTFSLFAVVAMALIVSWFVAVIFAPLLGVLILSPPKSTDKKEGFLLRAFVAAHGRDPCEMAHHSCHPSVVCGFPFRSSTDSQSVLSVLRPARAPCRSDLAAERVHPRDQDRGGAIRQSSQGRSGRRAVEHLCWPRRHTLLSASRRAVAQRFLWSGRRSCEGCAGARAAEGQARKNSRRRLPGRRVPCLSTRTRSTRRMAGPVSRQRARHRSGSRDRPQARAGRRHRPTRQERQF